MLRGSCHSPAETYWLLPSIVCLWSKEVYRCKPTRETSKSSPQLIPSSIPWRTILSQFFSPQRRAHCRTSVRNYFAALRTICENGTFTPLLRGYIDDRGSNYMMKLAAAATDVSRCVLYIVPGVYRRRVWRPEGYIGKDFGANTPLFFECRAKLQWMLSPLPGLAKIGCFK